MTNTLLFFLKNLSFSKPNKSEFIIFDDTNSEIVAEVIPENYSQFIFKTRPVQLKANPKIFLRFVSNLKYFEFKGCFGSKRGFTYRFFWQLLMIYVKSDLEIREPKAIITFMSSCKS